MPEFNKKAKRNIVLKHRETKYAEKKKKKKSKKKKERAKSYRKKTIKRNKKYVEKYKIENPCPCGETEFCCLSFHHNKGEKTGNISDMVNRGYSIKRIQLEINKCVVLCLNCHSKFHNMTNKDLELFVVKNAE